MLIDTKQPTQAHLAGPAGNEYHNRYTYTARKNTHELATHAHKRVCMRVRAHTERGLRPVGTTIVAPAITNAIRCTPQLQAPCMRARVSVHMKVP
jgi:hypothetical protein